MIPTLIRVDEMTRCTLAEALQPIITSMRLDDDYLKFVIELEQCLLAPDTPLSVGGLVLDDDAVERLKEILMLVLPTARGIASQRQLSRLLNRL